MLRPARSPRGLALACLCWWLFAAVGAGSTVAGEALHSTPEPAPRLLRTDNADTLRHDFNLMGTTISFVIAGEEPARAQEAIEAAEREMRRIASLLTDWEHPQHQGDVARINLGAAQGPVTVAEETFRLLQAAMDLAQRSDGKFDISYAALGELWDFRPAEAGPRLPDPEQVRATLERVDYRQLKLDADARSVRFARPGMRIGLGGIGKGYAVDRAVQVLRAGGLDDFVVNAGGDLAVVARLQAGQGDGGLWRVGIRHPRNPQQLVAVVPAANLSVATSGDYERFFELDGVRYAHILDPDTGYPARLCRSVTVLAGRTYLADALATAVFILGPEHGMALVETQEGVEALIIDADGEMHRSSGLATVTLP
ncbi:MAG: FAD:protein FMN transferase [Halioglobus sp.]|nr:FAD:protein FMN transferase [Halioglobus sp.]